MESLGGLLLGFEWLEEAIGVNHLGGSDFLREWLAILPLG